MKYINLYILDLCQWFPASVSTVSPDINKNQSYLTSTFVNIIHHKTKNTVQHSDSENFNCLHTVWYDTYYVSRDNKQEYKYGCKGLNIFQLKTWQALQKERGALRRNRLGITDMHCQLYRMAV